MGRRLVAITDNADPMAIRVYQRRRRARGRRLVCRRPVFERGRGLDRSVADRRPALDRRREQLRLHRSGLDAERRDHDARARAGRHRSRRARLPDRLAQRRARAVGRPEAVARLGARLHVHEAAARRHRRRLVPDRDRLRQRQDPLARPRRHRLRLQQQLRAGLDRAGLERLRGRPRRDRPVRRRTLRPVTGIPAFKGVCLPAESGIEVLSRGGDNSAQLAAARARIAELETEIARLSARDPLVPTLLTLPAFRAQVELDVQRAQRYSRPLSLAVLDIDDFRRLNMARGLRRRGTWSWRASANCWRRAPAPTTWLAGPAGDEFFLLLPGDRGRRGASGRLDGSSSTSKPLKPATSAASRLRSASRRCSKGDTVDALLGHAQNALALARAEGGGRVHVSDAASEAGAGAGPVGASADVVAALAQALEERDQYTGEHSESVVDLTARVAEALALRRRRGQDDPQRGAAARHRQGRDPRRDPPQARPARRARVGGHAPAPGDRRAHPARDPGHGRGRADRPPRARALGRRRAIRTNSSARRSRSARGSSSPATPTTR